MNPNQTIDLQRVVREIEEEVRRKRATGELPSALEQQLDLDFARYAPAGAAGTDLEQVLARVDQRSHIDVNPPLTSSKPGFSHAKRVLRKLMRWYVRAIAEQTSAFASAITRAVNLLADRVRRIERKVGSDDVLRIVEEQYAHNFVPADETIAYVVESLANVKGRTLHACAGSGWLLTPLRQAGTNAYGVEPVLAIADEGTANNVDVRPGDVAKHLASLDDNALGAVVLSGVVDYQTQGERNFLLDLAAQKVADGGLVIVVAANPEAWTAESLHAVCDLAPGQPFVAATWIILMESIGLVVDVLQMHSNVSYAVVARKPAQAS